MSPLCLLSVQCVLLYRFSYRLQAKNINELAFYLKTYIVVAWNFAYITSLHTQNGDDRTKSLPRTKCLQRTPNSSCFVISMRMVLLRLFVPFLSGFDGVSCSLCVGRIRVHAHSSPVNIMHAHQLPMKIRLPSSSNFTKGAVAAQASSFHIRRVFFEFWIAASNVMCDVVLIAGLFARLSACTAKRSPKTATDPLSGERCS